MAGDLLFTLTLITNFLCMAIALWFAIFLLARSSSNPLTFRAVVALLALAFYYINALEELVSSGANTGQVRSLSILITLIATHDLTHYLLPPLQRRKYYWIARAVILLGVIAIVLLFNPGLTSLCDPRYQCPSALNFPWVVIDAFKILFVGAILFNLWMIRKTENPFQTALFYEAVLLGSGALVYGLAGTVLRLTLPRFIPNLMILAALLLLLYSATRDRTLIARRTFAYDLPISLVTIAVIVGIYIWSAARVDLTPMETLLLAALAIFTHSAYDFVREFLDRMFRKQERRMRQELRSFAQEAGSEEVLERFLRRALAILCHNLRSHGGWIALCQEGKYLVVASLHSLPAGAQFSRHELRQEGEFPSMGTLREQRFRLAPAYAGQEEVALIGLRAQNEKLPFNQEDLFWLEEVAEEIGWMINTHRQPQPASPETPNGNAGEAPTGVDEAMAAGQLFSKLAYKLDPHLVRAVEEGFRNLNDYSKLGKSSLAGMLGIHAPDHIEAGKQVQRRLNEVIGELRPPGEPPAEPLPREWYAYTILHDAYVEERLAREIMSRLYISEGTYFRLRRQALRGVARALMESGAVD